MDELFECKNLKKLKIYEFSSFFVPLFNMQRIEKKINLLQNLKNLHTLGFNSDIIKNNSFANTVNSLKVLESIALYGNVETEILENFLNLTYKKPITNFEVKIRLNDLVWHQAYYCIEKILLSYQNLEHLKVAVEGLDSEKNSKIAFETIKNILLHPSLYKFNGIPIKKIEADESFTITLYENLVYFNNTLPEIFGSDLTSQLLLYYQDKISKMTELQIKSKFSATKCVNLEKLVKKIQTLGFFADSHYYFKLPKIALIAVLLMIKDQLVFKSLKLESFYNGIHFLEILQSSLYLESFSGFYNDLSKALFSKITSLSLDFKKRKINVSDLVFILTSSNLQTVIIKNAMIVKDSQVSEIQSSIKELHPINFQTFSEETIEELGKIINCLKLLEVIVIDISYMKVLFFGSLLQLLKEQKNLRILKIYFYESIIRFDLKVFIECLEKEMPGFVELKELHLFLHTDIAKNQILKTFLEEFTQQNSKKIVLNDLCLFSKIKEEIII